MAMEMAMRNTNTITRITNDKNNALAMATKTAITKKGIVMMIENIKQIASHKENIHACNIGRRNNQSGTFKRQTSIQF